MDHILYLEKVFGFVVRDESNENDIYTEGKIRHRGKLKKRTWWNEKTQRKFAQTKRRNKKEQPIF